MDEHKVPLDKIEKVTIPAVVACEVPGCSWLIPNERGSFQEYNHHLCQHTDEERQALAAAAEAFFKAAHIDGSPGGSDA